MAIDPTAPFAWMFCPPYGPEAYTEVAVISTDTQEVVHAYRLKEGYSLLRSKGNLYATDVGIGSTGTKYATFSLAYWENYSDPNRENHLLEPRTIWLNLYTGELLSNRPYRTVSDL